jgi:hypothetical protein
MQELQHAIEKTPIVTYLTTVSLQLGPDPDDCRQVSAAPVVPESVRQLGRLAAERAERVAAMMDFMAALSFSFEVEKNAVRCYSNTVEAGEIKRMLLKEGFKDREFQIVLEYTRGWGML